MPRRSAPASSRCVAQVWRSACGCRSGAAARRARRSAAPGAAPGARSSRVPRAREEQRVRILRAACAGCGARRALAVARRAPRAHGSPNGHDALLAALAEHAHAAARAQVEPLEVEPDELAHAQARAVEQLEHGAVAHAQRLVGAAAVGISTTSPASAIDSGFGSGTRHLGQAQALGGVVGDLARCAAGRGRTRAARRSCARWWPSRCRSRSWRESAAACAGRARARRAVAPLSTREAVQRAQIAAIRLRGANRGTAHADQLFEEAIDLLREQVGGCGLQSRRMLAGSPRARRPSISHRQAAEAARKNARGSNYDILPSGAPRRLGECKLLSFRH